MAKIVFKISYWWNRICFSSLTEIWLVFLTKLIQSMSSPAIDPKHIFYSYINNRIKTLTHFNMNFLIRFTIKHASIWICANNDPVEVFLRLFSSRLKIIIPLLSMIYQQRRIYSVGSEIKIQFILNVLNPYYELQPKKNSNALQVLKNLP